MQQLNFKFIGTTPLLLHSNRSADPLDIYAKALKPISKKRSKTDADQMEISRIEWEAGLYLDDDGYVCMPCENIDAMILKSAKRTKSGPKIRDGVMTNGISCRLDFPDAGIHLTKKPESQDDVPSRELDPLYDKYKDRRMVKIQRNSIVRTRPRFDKWSLRCSIDFDPEIIDERTLLEIVETASKYVGLGDYRERYGKFDALIVG